MRFLSKVLGIILGIFLYLIYFTYILWWLDSLCEDITFGRPGTFYIIVLGVFNFAYFLISSGLVSEFEYRHKNKYEQQRKQSAQPQNKNIIERLYRFTDFEDYTDSLTPIKTAIHKMLQANAVVAYFGAVTTLVTPALLLCIQMALYRDFTEKENKAYRKGYNECLEQCKKFYRDNGYL